MAREGVAMITLSMIVKNEEAVLSQCLKSVRDFVEEIIIVDTGSTDRTIEIAREAQAQVESFEWVDCFSSARNFALSFVRTPWTLTLDADDIVLNPELIGSITEFSRRKRHNAIWSTYLQDGETKQRRLQIFKTKEYLWQGHVHETPQPKRPGDQSHLLSGLQILHRKPVERTRPDALRYLKILLEKDPENWLGIAESYRFLAINPDDPARQQNYRAQAETYYWKAANHPGTNEPTQYMALFQAAKIGLEMAVEQQCRERLKLAYKTAEIAYLREPKRAEALVLLGQISQAMGHKDHAKRCYNEALRLPLPDGIGVVYDQYYREIPIKLLKTIN
jgi:glycosyltransferase involved in cell wall biosynthesis